jgi:hypothetical protein
MVKGFSFANHWRFELTTQAIDGPWLLKDVGFQRYLGGPI